jgi:putative ABC transport system permease protein
MREILQRVAVLMLIGVSAGWLLTLALKRTLSSVLELQAFSNAGLLLALTLALIFFGIAASLLPARRAASIEPTQALRAE